MVVRDMGQCKRHNRAHDERDQVKGEASAMALNTSRAGGI